MNFSLCRWAILFVWLTPSLTADIHSRESQSPTALDSPRLAALTQEIKAGRQDSLERFWAEMKGKTPLVEPISGNDSLRLVTFLFRGGDEMHGIALIGPVPPEMRRKQLSHLADTDLWFLTVRLPKAARFSYAFLAAGKKYTDPFNLHPLTAESESMAEMSDAPAQAWIQPLPNVPTGEIKTLKINSDILKKERSVSVYTPAGYAADKRPYGLLIVFDGWDYRRLIPLPTILDNLIASRKITPLVAVLIHNESQATRNRELGCDEQFTDFLAKELVPWARKSYRIGANPMRTIVAGASLGGVAAAYCGLRYPEIFGNVLSQSGAFWHYPGWPGKEVAENGTGWLARQFEAQRKLPVRFYMEAGLFEIDAPLTILAENRRLRDVLKAKGYELTYSEFVGGHDYINWRGSVADGLIALVGKDQ